MGIIRKNRTEIQTREIRAGNPVLAVVIAGFGYSLDQPHLYYLIKSLTSSGADVLGLDYSYAADPEFMGLPEAEQDLRFEEDNRQVIPYVENRGADYDRVVLIGKSLGTSVARRFFPLDVLREKRRFVFLTPGTEWSGMIPEIAGMSEEFLIIGSLEDRHFTAGNREPLRGSSRIKMLEFTKGNHSLETGDLRKDLEITATVVESIRDFVFQGLK